MIKSYESKWKKSCLIKLAANQMSEQYDAILRNLSAPISTPQIRNENDSASIVCGIRNDAAA